MLAVSLVVMSGSFKSMGIVDNRKYRYTRELLTLQRATGPLQHLSRGPSPVNLQVLAPYLLSHPDQGFAQYVLNGLQQGFCIGFDRSSSRLRPLGHNHPSLMANREVITRHVAQELAAGRYISPLVPHIYPGLQLSPIGLVPKAHLVDQWRVIVDLSSPIDCSVNDGTSPNLYLLSIRLWMTLWKRYYGRVWVASLLKLI